jgi:hypothetical protein
MDTPIKKNSQAEAALLNVPAPLIFEQTYAPVPVRYFGNEQTRLEMVAALEKAQKDQEKRIAALKK